MTERIRLGFPTTDAKQLDASTTATRYLVLSDTGTFCEVAVRTREMAMILMSGNRWKAVSTKDSSGFLASIKDRLANAGQKEIHLCKESCFVLTDTSDV